MLACVRPNSETRLWIGKIVRNIDAFGRHGRSGHVSLSALILEDWQSCIGRVCAWHGGILLQQLESSAGLAPCQLQTSETLLFPPSCVSLCLSTCMSCWHDSRLAFRVVVVVVVSRKSAVIRIGICQMGIALRASLFPQTKRAAVIFFPIPVGYCGMT